LTIRPRCFNINRYGTDGERKEHLLNENSEYSDFLSQVVVLDTGGPIVYIGKLEQVTPAGFVLLDADLHDSRDGHATSESYVNAARTQGVSSNRRHILVMKSAVMSISKLDDVVEQ
jgi:hypothetical protein